MAIDGEPAFHLAQLNVARLRAPLDDPMMAGFVAGLGQLNALADAAPGFVWRLCEGGADDATGLRPFGPDLLVNLSLWTSVAALRGYAYQTVHLDWLRRRRDWFSHDGLAEHLVLWWVPAGERPTLGQAWDRLQRLGQDGPGPLAFTLREPYPVPAGG